MMRVSNRGRWNLFAGLVVALALSAVPAAQRFGVRPPPTPPLTFQFMGPAVGNRISAVAGVPGDPKVYYAGAASGGVWKSTDGGDTFAPIFDKEPVAAIGALAVAPSEPEHRVGGHGRGLGDPRRRHHGRRRLRLHRRGQDVGAHGPRPDRPHRPHRRQPDGPERRVRVRARPDHRPAAGARRVQHDRRRRDVEARAVRQPRTPAAPASPCPRRTPNVLFAGTWQVVMHTWAMFGGGPGSGVYMSHRRRRDLDEGRGSGPAEAAAGQDRRGLRALRRQPRLRAHPDRRPGLALAVGRRRRDVEGRELGPHAHRPRRLLHPPGGEPRRTPTRCSSPTAASTAPPTAASPSRTPTGAAATATTSGWTRRTRTTG